MSDVRVAGLAARQHNRFSRAQLLELGIDDSFMQHRLDAGRWVHAHQAVYAIAPDLRTDMGKWTAATLTGPDTSLSMVSAGAAWGFWDRPRAFETVTRPGSGGPKRYDGLLVYRSERLAGDLTIWRGLPITTVPRTLLDLAPHVDLKTLARMTREAIRLGLTTAADIVDALATRHRGRRGSRKLLAVLARYTGLPVERCRSGAEVRALEILRDAGRPSPDVNRRVAGEEADLSWRAHRLIVEIDGPQYHLDRGEDERKQRRWERAGWVVHRIPSPEVFEHPERLLALTPSTNVDGSCL